MKSHPKMCFFPPLLTPPSCAGCLQLSGHGRKASSYKHHKNVCTHCMTCQSQSGLLDLIILARADHCFILQELLWLSLHIGCKKLDSQRSVWSKISVNSCAHQGTAAIVSDCVSYSVLVLYRTRGEVVNLRLIQYTIFVLKSSFGALSFGTLLRFMDYIQLLHMYTSVVSY